MKKKMTLLAIFTLIAAFTFAQPQGRRQQVSRLTDNGLVLRNLATGLNSAVAQSSARLSTTPRREPSNYPVIQEQPDGREATYAPTAGKYFYIGTDNKIYQTDITQKMTVVFGENNKVYLKDPLSMGVSSWLEGTLSSDGKTISIPVGQNLFYASQYDVAYQAYMMDFDATQNDYVKTADNTIEYSLTVDGLKMKGTSQSHMVGVAFKTTNAANLQYDNMWSGYGAYEAEYTLTTTPKKEVVTLPEGVTSQAWTLNAETYTYDENNYPTGRTNRKEAKVQVAIDGNDFYVQGLCSYLPKSWVKGTRNGNAVTFPTMQYFGVLYNTYHLFFEGSTDDGQTDKDVVFTYNEATKELKTTDAIWITYDDNYVDVYFNTVLKQTGDQPSGNTNVIREQPAGELKTYVRSGSGFAYNFFYGLYQTSQSGMVADVVFDADGTTVWFKNPVSNYMNNTWVKGTRNGNTITMPLNQCVEYYEEDGYGLVMAYMVKVLEEEDGETYINYVKDYETPCVTFTIDDAKGTISLNGTDANGETYPAYILGLVYLDIDPDYDGAWVGYGDWETVFSPNNYKGVTAPEDLQTEEWNFTFSNDGGPRTGKVVNAGIQGNDLYIQGISELIPDAWVKGVINGDKVTFEQNQYMGTGEGYLIFMKGAKAELLYDEDWEEYYIDYTLLNGPLTLNYDANAKTLSGEDSFIENAGNEDIYYYATYDNPFFNVHVSKSAKPVNPEITGYYEYFDDYGYNTLNFFIPAIDVDGNVIASDKLAFQLYTNINGEVEDYTFYADEYQLTEDRVVMGYNESIYDLGGYYLDIYGKDGYAYLYQSGFDDIGIQSINYTAGEEKRSDIVWYANNQSGVKAVNTAEIVDIRYTDLAGRTVNRPTRGLYIKTMRLADGTQRSVKVMRK